MLMTEVESLANNQMGELSKHLSAVFLIKLKEHASIYFVLRATDSFESQETRYPNLEYSWYFAPAVYCMHTLIICSNHQIQFLIRPESIRPTRSYVLFLIRWMYYHAVSGLDKNLYHGILFPPENSRTRKF